MGHSYEHPFVKYDSFHPKNAGGASNNSSENLLKVTVYQGLC